jgi:hypothetical protein
MRIALVSSPRSGNTWLRHLLSKLFAVPHLAVHCPDELDWDAQPGGCVLQVHWPPETEFRRLLQRHRFRTVVLARHPLDVLLSILHFALYEPETRRWLGGAGGNERPILGVGPCSAVFLSYALHKRATALLNVSCRWWSDAVDVRMRYEDLVADPAAALAGIAQVLRAAAVTPPATVAAETSMPWLRRQTGRPHHFWQGKPGLWRHLLPAPRARRIAAAQRDSFVVLDYSCDPDEHLTDRIAEKCWKELNAVDELDRMFSPVRCR